MENASKALIIAGAILLAILIIGLGMFVYQQASGAMDGIGMDTEKVTAYNSKFTQYEGTISGSEAKALYSVIREHNNGHVDDTTLQVVLTIDKGDLDPSTNFTASATDKATMDANTLKNGATYNVTFQTDGNSGYITKCNIETKD